MRALVKIGKEVGFSCRDVAVPVPGPGEVLVKVHATGICGSDIQWYLWNALAERVASRLSVSFPFVDSNMSKSNMRQLRIPQTDLTASQIVGLRSAKMET